MTVNAESLNDQREQPLREIEVGCAVIYRQGKLLVGQRRPGDTLGGYWEFPGGKRNPAETFEACIEREVFEEMAVRVKARRFIKAVTHDFLSRRIHLHFYICDFLSGEPVLHECMDARWVALEDLKNYQFPPADRDLLNELVERKLYYFGG